ncbi:geraniol 8-hydroxylase-like [Pistacia vera]|uniref:geraniol 8-hydroxylase-like n=1 Tax=Pistacia vera TaxID=55513 RepID=UPI001263D24E|nr:geraniol 8-hydroxylase-like [Pistacia vera]
MAFDMSSWWCDPSDEKCKIFTVIITCFVVVLGVIWNLKKSKRLIPPLPPGPRGFPVIGYLPFLDSHLAKSFTELAGDYGPIYKVWLGNKLCVVVSSPSLAKEVVCDQDTICANRDPPGAVLFSSYGENNIAWAPYGSAWRKLRKIFVTNLMSNASLEVCYPLRKQVIKKTIRDVYSKVGEPVDVGELSLATLINVVQNMMWGGSLEGEKRTNLGVDLRELFAEFMVLLATPNVSDLFPVLSRFDLQGIQKRTKKLLSSIERIILDPVIEGYRNTESVKEGEGKNEKKDFLQLLLELTEHKDSANSITKSQLKALLLDMILGGTDTTTTMAEWTMAELMKHPEIMKKVQEELAEVVGMDGSVEEFHLPKLKYLDAVVKETLRLHPALPFLVPRSPSETCTIGGYTIPKGSRIMINVGAIQTDPRFWENPLEFRPERFLNDPGKFDYMGKNFQYMPFGSGRRVCPGINLAEKMLMSVLASLLHSFEWKLPDGTELDLSDQFGIVVKKMKPLIAVPTPRLSNLELY